METKDFPENSFYHHTILLLFFLSLAPFLFRWHFETQIGNMWKLFYRILSCQYMVVRMPCLFSHDLSAAVFFIDHALVTFFSSAISKMASLRVLVGCKRVIDYAVKVCKIYLKLQLSIKSKILQSKIFFISCRYG